MNYFKKDWLLYSVIPFIFVFIHSTIAIPTTVRSLKNIAIALTVAVMVVIYYFILLRNLNNQIGNIMAANEKELFKNQIDALTTQIELVNTIEDNQRIMRHDIRHNAKITKALIVNKEYDDAIDYLSEFIALNDSINSVHICENSVINATLNYYRSIAETENITVSFNVFVPSKMKVKDFDLSIILANALENAINASKHCKEKKLSVKSKIQEGQMFFEIKNTFNKEITFDEDGFPITTKNSHGFGTKSIKNFVEKYHTMVNYKVVGNEFILRFAFKM